MSNITILEIDHYITDHLGNEYVITQETRNTFPAAMREMKLRAKAKGHTWRRARITATGVKTKPWR